MCDMHALLKCRNIELPGFAALFSHHQGCAYRLHLRTALLFAPDQVSDKFAVVGVIPCIDLRFDPSVLLVGQRTSASKGSGKVLATSKSRSEFVDIVFILLILNQFTFLFVVLAKRPTYSSRVRQLNTQVYDFIGHESKTYPTRG